VQGDIRIPVMVGDVVPHDVFKHLYPCPGIRSSAVDISVKLTPLSVILTPYSGYDSKNTID
jgi:hypothetical protein